MGSFGWRESDTLGLVGVLELAPTLMRCGGDLLSCSGGSADLYVWVSLSPLKGISAVAACGLSDGPEEGESMPRGMGPSCPRNIDSSWVGGSFASLQFASL